MDDSGLKAAAGGIVLLTLCAVALLLLPRLFCFWNRRPGQGGWFAALQAGGWTLLLIAFLAQSATYGMGLIAFGVLAGAGLTMTMVVEQKRRGQREVLLRMISIALARRLPMTPVLETFGRDAVGWTGDVGAALGQSLSQGMALDEALAQAGDPLGETAGVLVRVGRQTDNLDQSLKMLATAEKQSGPLWQAFGGRVYYLGMLTLCLLGVVTFGMIYIVPSMVKIFKEFAIPLPLTTRAVVAASDVFLYGGLVVQLLALAVPTIFLYASWRFVGHARRDLSRWGRIGLPLHRACILDCLALAAEKGWPLENTSGLLAAIYPRRFVRKRVGAAHQRMQQGRDWLEGLCEASILRKADVAALRLAGEPGHLAWSMRELAAASRRRFLQRAQALVQIAFPLLLMCLGLAAAMIAIAMFMPLVAIIHSLT